MLINSHSYNLLARNNRAIGKVVIPVTSGEGGEGEDGRGKEKEQVVSE